MTRLDRAACPAAATTLLIAMGACTITADPAPSPGVAHPSTPRGSQGPGSRAAPPQAVRSSGSWRPSADPSTPPPSAPIPAPPGLPTPPPGPPIAPPTRTLSTAALEVTEGRIDTRGDHLAIEAPAVRAVRPGTSGQAATLDVTYRGPTDARRALASGADRTQFGLKLRAQDSCNVLYVMWRAEPSAVVVQLKRNRHATTHRQCGNAGYTRLRPLRAAKVPALAPGDRHQLAAEIVGDNLEVKIDGTVVWHGTLPTDAHDLAGPAGVRTDNARVEFTLDAT